MKQDFSTLRLAAVSLLFALSSSAMAQSAWPVAPVKIVVPFPPGGTTDVVARLLATHLSDTFDNRFVVENRAGANTIIGTEAVTRAKPDGQTLLLTTAPFSVVAALSTKLSYRPEQDLIPIARLGENPMLLVASTAAPAVTMQDMLKVGREEPGKLLVATVGTTGMSAMANELLSVMGKVSTTAVPYKGTGAVISDLVGGTVHYLFDNPSSSLPLVQSGKLKAIAFTGKQRNTALPDVPTVAESGLPGFETVNWYGLFAPAGTPEEVVKKLNQSINAFISQPEIKSRFAAEAIDGIGGSAEDFKAFLTEEIQKWARIGKERNIQLSH